MYFRKSLLYVAIAVLFAAPISPIGVAQGAAPSSSESSKQADNPDEEFDHLLNQLHSRSFIQRDWAARRLRERGDAIVPRLEQTVRASEDESTAIAVVHLLARMSQNKDNSSAIPALTALASLHDEPGDLSSNLIQEIDAAYHAGTLECLAHLKSFGAEIERGRAHQIIGIIIRSSEFTDKDIPRLAVLTHLTRLDLRGSSVSRHGLPEFAPLKRLEQLNLSDTPITGTGLQQLPKLPSLRQLVLYRIELTAEDRQWLRLHFPECEIRP